MGSKLELLKIIIQGKIVYCLDYIPFYLETHKGISGIIAILVVALLLGGIAYFIAVRITKESRFSFNLSPMTMNIALQSRDKIDKWIQSTEEKVKRHNKKLKIKKYLYVHLFLAVATFLLTLHIFKNLAAAIFLSLTFLIIPDYILGLIGDLKTHRTEDQLLLAIRMFMTEYLRHYQLERAFAALSLKIANPVGQYFADAHYGLLTGEKREKVLSDLAMNLNSPYGLVFVQMVEQTQKNSKVIELFPDLAGKLEMHIELTRTSISTLTAERLTGIIMAIIPFPTYIMMKRLIPETQEFVTQTTLGKMLITMSFASLLLWALIDNRMRRVDS